MSVSLFVTPHIQVQLRAESVSGILPADSRIPLPSPVPCSDDDGYCDDRYRQRKQRYGRCGINIRKCAHNLARAFVFVDRFAYNGIERYRRYSVRNGKNNSSRGFVDKQAYAGTRAAGTSVYQHVSFLHPVYVTFFKHQQHLAVGDVGYPIVACIVISVSAESRVSRIKCRRAEYHGGNGNSRAEQYYRNAQKIYGDMERSAVTARSPCLVFHHSPALTVAVILTDSG